jgi:hypothetical protein
MTEAPSIDIGDDLSPMSRALVTTTFRIVTTARDLEGVTVANSVVDLCFALYDALGIWPFFLLLGLPMLWATSSAVNCLGVLALLGFMGSVGWSFAVPDAIVRRMAAAEQRKAARAESAFEAQYGPRDATKLPGLGVLVWKQASEGTSEVIFDGNGRHFNGKFEKLGDRLNAFGSWVAKKPDERLPLVQLIVVDRADLVDRYGAKTTVDGVVFALKSDDLRKIQWGSLPPGGALMLAEMRSVHPAHAEELGRWCYVYATMRGPAFCRNYTR